MCPVLRIHYTADGTENPITSRRWNFVGSTAWLADGSGLIVQAQDPAVGPQSQFWRITYPGGEARALTNDLNNYGGISLTADSGMLATVKSDYSSNIWIAPDGNASRATRVTSGADTSDGRNGLAWTPDGRIVYTSAASGNSDLWIMNADGSNNQQLTVDAGWNSYPSVSPDGRYVVFSSNREGAVNIWRMDMNGGDLKRLTNTHGAERPRCSPDGRWVVYEDVSSGKLNLWKVPMDGGNAVQLTDKQSVRPNISPDGKLLAYGRLNEQNQPQITIIPVEGGRPIKVLDYPTTANAWSNYRWTLDGRAVIGGNTINGVSNIWRRPLDGGPSKQLTDFKSDLIWEFDVSRDGRHFALSRGVGKSDVVLISGLK